MSERAKNLAEKALEIFRDCLHNAGDYWIEDELAISRIQKLIDRDRELLLWTFYRYVDVSDLVELRESGEVNANKTNADDLLEIVRSDSARNK